MHIPIALHADGRAAAPAASLALWETLMRQAVADERAHRRESARAGYERALSIARGLIDAPPPGRAQDCLAALAVSYLNLADLHAESGDADAAAHLLCRAHEALIALTLDAERPATLRQDALRHSRETHVALLRHVARHGPHASIARVLRLADAALNGGGANANAH